MALVIPASFKELGMKQYDEPEFYRMIMYSYGLDATGKTDFAMSAPGPLVIFNNDKELGDMPRRRFPKKLIVEVPYFMPTDIKKAGIGAKQAAAVELLRDFMKKFRTFVKDPAVRTIIIDNGTNHWKFVQLAIFGSLKSGKSSYSFDVPNAEMDILFDLVRQSKKNLIIIHQADKVWSAKKSSSGKDVSTWDGKSYECKGWSHINFKPTVGLYHRRDKTDMYAEVVKCSHNRDLHGYALMEEELSFPALGKLIYPESPDSAWK